jgi:hypothetical protein
MAPKEKSDEYDNRLLSLSPEEYAEGVGLTADSGSVNAAYEPMRVPAPVKLGVLSRSSVPETSPALCAGGS